MRKTIILVTVGAALCALGGCIEQQPISNKDRQANKAAEAAASIKFVGNGEIDNIKKRHEQTADPNKLGYIVLLNSAGQPILYEGVVGKITSSGKRLTPISESRCIPSFNEKGERNGCNYAVVPGPSDEGTYGSSSEYVFYWNTDSVYRQWSGQYLYSDQPIRLRTELLVVNVKN